MKKNKYPVLFFLVGQLFFCGPAFPQEKISDVVSISNVFTGQFLTEIYNSANGYIYAYPAYAYRNDSSRQNFKVTYLDNGAVSFTYKPFGSCLADYNNYSVIDGECGNNQRKDQWKILPVDTGAVRLQNMYTGKCLTVSDGASYSNLQYDDCGTAGSSVHAKDMWIISAPRANGTAP